MHPDLVKLIVLIVAVGTLTSLLVGFVVFNEDEDISEGEPHITDVSYHVSSTENGDFIVLRVETENCTDNVDPQCQTETYFGGSGGGSSGGLWDEQDDGVYSRKIGPFENSTEVWIMVYLAYEDNFEWGEMTVGIGEEPADSTDGELSIENVSGVPESIELDDSKKITVNISGDHGAEVNIHHMYAYSSKDGWTGSGSGGGLIREERDWYVAYLRTGPREDVPSNYSGVYLFRVTCEKGDQTVVTDTYVVEVSESEDATNR